jgi:hypothetical protein
MEALGANLRRLEYPAERLPVPEAVEVDGPSLLGALASLLYWVMMAPAAFEALVQVAFALNYWESAPHGLTGRAQVEIRLTGTTP